MTKLTPEHEASVRAIAHDEIMVTLEEFASRGGFVIDSVAVLGAMSARDAALRQLDSFPHKEATDAG